MIVRFKQSFFILRYYTTVLRFSQLEQFILEEMRKEKERNYQPQMILTLFNNNGKASKEEIQRELQKANPDYLINYFTNCPVFEVLTKNHPVATYDKSLKLYSVLDYETYFPEEKQKIIDLCEYELQKSYSLLKNVALKILLEVKGRNRVSKISHIAIQKRLITYDEVVPKNIFQRIIREDIRLYGNRSFFKEVDNDLYEINENNTIEYFIASGPWRNWDHTLKNPPLRWGVEPLDSNLGVFNALSPGDIVYFYATKDPPIQFSVQGLFGIGRVIRKYDEDREPYWIEEKSKNQVIYKNRFEIELIKSVETDSELLPWIDGLPIRKRLNKIADNKNLQELIENTRKKWDIVLPVMREIYNEIIDEKQSELPMNTFDDDTLPIPNQDELKHGYEKISDELFVPETKVNEIVIALVSGRHVLLAGPIGTGKTRLAKIIPEIIWERVGGYYSEDHTATADWSTQDVIGGLFPKTNQGKIVYEIQNGCVVETVSKNWEDKLDGGKRCYSDSNHRGTWLIIDEFNRADIDKAFGQLFTALRTRSLKIPTDRQGRTYQTLKIPKDYRIIGTLNATDKHFLFQLSDALKSRFAYIEIDIPSRKEFEKEIYYAMKNAIDELGTNNYDSLITLDHANKKIDKEKSNVDFYMRVYQAYHFLDLVRIFKKLGTAILKLVYQNLLVGIKITGDSKLALDISLKSNLIPQLENLSRSAIESMYHLYSEDIVEFFKNAYRSPNKQSYAEDFTKTLSYLEIQNSSTLSKQFADGTLQDKNNEMWNLLKEAQKNKKMQFELELDQLKQSISELTKSIAI